MHLGSQAVIQPLLKVSEKKANPTLMLLMGAGGHHVLRQNS